MRAFSSVVGTHVTSLHPAVRARVVKNRKRSEPCGFSSPRRTVYNMRGLNTEHNNCSKQHIVQTEDITSAQHPPTSVTGYIHSCPIHMLCHTITPCEKTSAGRTSTAS